MEIFNQLWIPLGASVLGGLITAISNHKINNKKVKSEIVVEARKEWITNVRNLVESLVSELENNLVIKLQLDDRNNYVISQFSNPHNIDKDRLNRKEVEKDELIEKEAQSASKIQGINVIFTSYFPDKTDLNLGTEKDNTDNIEIIKKLDNLLKKHKVYKQSLGISSITNESRQTLSKDRLKELLNNQSKSETEYYRALTDFTNKFSYYIKKEWERIKKLK